jgi:hypothetical protein
MLRTMPVRLSPRRRRQFAGLLAGLLVLLLAGCQGDEWRDYNAPDGSFSVRFPGEPVSSSASQTTEFGPVATQTLRVGTGAREIYQLAYSDYPLEYVVRTTPDALVRLASLEAVRATGGEVVTEQSLRLGTHPGHELRMTTPAGGVLTMRLYFVRTRLYQLTVSTPGTQDVQRLESFFNSFTLTSQE